MAKNKGPVTIHYVNRTNYVDIAAILVQKLADAAVVNPGIAEFMNTEDFDAEMMGQDLVEMFDTEILIDLLNSEFGQGIIFGMYISEKSHAIEAHEAEMLEKEEGEGSYGYE